MMSRKLTACAWPVVALCLAAVLAPSTARAQVSVSGSLTEHIDAIIAAMPGSYDGGQYLQPNLESRDLFREIFDHLLAGQYADAHTKALTRNYQVVLFADTTGAAPIEHVILQQVPGSTSRYWGTYVLNPAPSRPHLAIQSPHPRFDTNTGYQGIRIYRDAGARAFFTAGTHRCNGTTFSPCDGTSTVCSDSSEPYRYSDMSHVVFAIFHVATEQFLAADPELTIVQPHGFAMAAEDPYLIISNGTRFQPGGPDYAVQIRDALLALDPVLTAKVAHVDLDWTKLIATTNTQGRLLNLSGDPCGTAASQATGRFVHVEQGFSRLRDSEVNWAKLGQAIMTVFPVQSTTSLASGDWHDPATWSTGQVPTAGDDVVIAAGHVVAVGAAASCRDLTFAATSGKLDLTSAAAVLDVHGDFTFASSSHLAFEGWTEGARVRFAGDAPVQRLINLSTSASTGTTRFDELVVDKAAGKVTTGAESGQGDDRRLRIGRYLDIQSGTFELAETDDLEGRDNTGAATSPDILVRGEGIFDMAGGASHIRRGTFTGAETAKIGTLRVWGRAALSSGSTVRTNFTAVEIEAGGEVEYPAGRGTISGSFNPGTVTVRDGGVFRNSITTAYWYANGTTPTTLHVEPGGAFRTSTSTTALPQALVLDGEIRFFGSQDQTIPTGLPPIAGTLAITSEGTKTLGGDVAVDGRLLVFGQAQLATGGFALTYGPAAVLQYGDEGQTSAQQTSDAEFPAAGGPFAVVVHNESGVALHADRTIAGSLAIQSGNLLTGSHEITLGAVATLSEFESSIVLGSVRSARTLTASGQSDFGGLGLEITAGAVAPGATTVVRRTGEDLAPFGLRRHFDIAPAENAGLDATLTVRYGAWELDGTAEDSLRLFRSADGGGTWTLQGGTVDQVARTVTLAGIDAFSLWALAAADPSTTPGAVPAALVLQQNYPNPFNPQTTIVFRLPAAGEATLAVHDMRGRLVRTLAQGPLAAGRHETTWDGRDVRGQAAASGIYVVRLLTQGGAQRTMKVTLSK